MRMLSMVRRLRTMGLSAALLLPLVSGLSWASVVMASSLGLPGPSLGLCDQGTEKRCPPQEAKVPCPEDPWHRRSAEHTSELQSLMRISYAVFCLKKKKQITHSTQHKITYY